MKRCNGAFLFTWPRASHVIRYTHTSRGRACEQSCRRWRELERKRDREAGQQRSQALSALSCYVSYNVISRREQRCFTHRVQSRRRRRRTSRRPPESQSPSPLPWENSTRARCKLFARIYRRHVTRSWKYRGQAKRCSSRDCDRASREKIDSMYVRMDTSSEESYSDRSFVRPTYIYKRFKRYSGVWSLSQVAVPSDGSLIP